jgi:hypothetical protein
MLIEAKRKGLFKKYPTLSEDLEVNLMRFKTFLETLEKHIDLRNAIVKRKKTHYGLIAVKPVRYFYLFSTASVLCLLNIFQRK